MLLMDNVKTLDKAEGRFKGVVMSHVRTGKKRAIEQNKMPEAEASRMV